MCVLRRVVLWCRPDHFLNVVVIVVVNVNVNVA